MVGSNCAFMENICFILSHLWWHIYLTTCMMNYFNMWLIYIITQYQPIYLWFFKHAKKTGVGPQPKLPSAAEWKIIDLMKDRPNFSGIVGGFESSMPSTSNIKIFSILKIMLLKNTEWNILYVLIYFTKFYVCKHCLTTTCGKPLQSLVFTYIRTDENQMMID